MSLTAACLIAVIAAAEPAPVAAVDEAPRVIDYRVVVDAPLDAVWRTWSTNEGVRTFFAPSSNIEPRVDGAYEILFFPDAEPGRRGAEGMRILAFDPPRFLSFTWNAPATIPTIRAQNTIVAIRLTALDDGRTAVRLTHGGWGMGADWDEAFAYFDAAWRDVVLTRFHRRFAEGPADWTAAD